MNNGETWTITYRQVDISDLRFLVESESTCTKEAMRNVVKEVVRLETEERQAIEDEDRRPRVWPALKYHFTLIRYSAISLGL